MKYKDPIEVEKAIMKIEQNMDELAMKSQLAEMVMDSDDVKTKTAMHMICERYNAEFEAFESLRRGLSGYFDIQKPPRLTVIKDNMEVDIIVDPHAC